MELTKDDDRDRVCEYTYLKKTITLSCYLGESIYFVSLRIN